MNKICGTCRHYWKTTLIEYNLEPYIGKGYTIDETIKLSLKTEKPMPVYTCHLADNWTEPEDECIVDKWGPKDGMDIL